MNPLYLSLAPLALLSTVIPVADPASDRDGSSALAAPIGGDGLDAVPADLPLAEWTRILLAPPGADQIRFDQRIIIRIAPRPAPSAPPNAAALLAMPDLAKPKWKERKMGQCLPVAGIAGVQPAPSNRLMLFLRDGRLVNAQVGKGCKAQDFYLGFYVARSPDGMICAGRDTLQSRNGANCELGKLRQMVPKGK